MPELDELEELDDELDEELEELELDEELDDELELDDDELELDDEDDELLELPPGVVAVSPPHAASVKETRRGRHKRPIPLFKCAALVVSCLRQQLI